MLIIEGHKKLPEAIVSDFLRLLSVQQSNIIWICGTSDTQITTTPGMFQNNMLDFNLGGTQFLPTSKLTMEYLDNHIENLCIAVIRSGVPAAG